MGIVQGEDQEEGLERQAQTRVGTVSPPGDDEESKVDLSDGKKYLTDWMLLSEQKEGGMARQKANTKPITAASSSSSGGKCPSPPAPASAAFKPNKKKRKQ